MVSASTGYVLPDGVSAPFTVAGLPAKLAVTTINGVSSRYYGAPKDKVSAGITYAKNLEDEVQPQVHDVVSAVRRALYLEQ